MARSGRQLRLPWHQKGSSAYGEEAPQAYSSIPDLRRSGLGRLLHRASLVLWAYQSTIADANH